MPIKLAGAPQDKAETVYFKSQVEPLIDGKDVFYLGPVSQQEKRSLLRRASALLFPIQWEEHFGMVMVEAMACGTPVVAMKRGAVPEVIDAGITGFHGESIEEMEELVPRALLLDRKAVRDQAFSRFNHSRMTRGYLDLYRCLIAKRPNVCRNSED